MTRTIFQDFKSLAPLAAIGLALLTGCGGSDDDGSSADASASPSASAALPSLDPANPCPALVGDDGLVDRALAGADLSHDERQSLGEALFPVVSSGPKNLQDPVGQLVDYLDDPEAYQPLDGGSDDEVTAAAKAIRSACS
ncbi:hypothetical protein [Aeromicrobium sp. CnD17-E]|uniref:hypothetical protein n=1 Tax=Aeromicrobium sp. CnD17-E TaxID=2954487 RepID=UPI0020981ABD|nr:hypothetical protein [Aeromicrobium sp. CnD17-E]MCO7239073.1 hypothetical protein [Aeromicrobium sp. CnD17-E]